MKKLKIIFAMLALLPFLAVGSEEITTDGFIFSDYQKGKVYFKNNRVVESLFNYQTVTKQMLFRQNEQVLSLAYAQTTDSVVIGGRVFVYYQDNEFFEKIALGKGNLFIQYSSVLLSKGKKAGYGGYSQLSSTTSVNTISSLDGGQTSGLTHLSADEEFTAKTNLTFWIKRKDKFIKVNSQSQVLKAFPEYKQAIQSYFIDHKVNFGLLNDVKVVLDYCFSL